MSNRERTNPSPPVKPSPDQIKLDFLNALLRNCDTPEAIDNAVKGAEQLTVRLPHGKSETIGISGEEARKILNLYTQQDPHVVVSYESNNLVLTSGDEKFVLIIDRMDGMARDAHLDNWDLKNRIFLDALVYSAGSDQHEQYKGYIASLLEQMPKDGGTAYSAFMQRDLPTYQNDVMRSLYEKTGRQPWLSADNTITPQFRDVLKAEIAITERKQAEAKKVQPRKNPAPPVSSSEKTKKTSSFRLLFGLIFTPASVIVGIALDLAGYGIVGPIVAAMGVVVGLAIGYFRAPVRESAEARRDVSADATVGTSASSENSMTYGNFPLLKSQDGNLHLTSEHGDEVAVDVKAGAELRSAPGGSEPEPIELGAYQPLAGENTDSRTHSDPSPTSGPTR